MSNNKQTISHSEFTPRQVAEDITRAIWLGDTPQVIAGLSSLANFALESGHVFEVEETQHIPPVSMDSAMKTLFLIIAQCAEGNTKIYADLYGFCTQLNQSFLHADANAGLVTIDPAI